MPFRFEGSRLPIYMVRQNQHGKFAKACANKKAHNAYAASGGTLELCHHPEREAPKVWPEWYQTPP